MNVSHSEARALLRLLPLPGVQDTLEIDNMIVKVKEM